jgi:hypothetical protein
MRAIRRIGAAGQPVSRLRPARMTLAVAVGAGCFGFGGCASTTPASTTHRAASVHPLTRKSITATPLVPEPGVLNIRRGTQVRSRDLGVRAFVNGKRGFALAGLRNGETYPAATVDGGRKWRIDGPVFHIPAANAAATVTQAGAAWPDTYFAFGFGSVVDVTTDGGVHWWVAGLGDDVLAVVPGIAPHHLIAVVQNFLGSNTTKVARLVYVSPDGGRHWHLANRFAS